MKTPLLSTLLMGLSLVFFSCGNNGDKTGNDSGSKDSQPKAEEPEKAEFEDICKDQNAISITIKDYKYSMKGKYEFETANYEVKQSSWSMSSDSTASLTLKNYTQEELVGDRKDKQVDIIVEFRSRNGKKIGEGDYIYNDSQKDFSSSVQMLTSKGTVYFNWVMGMPEQGSVKLRYAGSDGVCGTFALASEKPESDMIGTVRLNGNFMVKN